MLLVVSFFVMRIRFFLPSRVFRVRPTAQKTYYSFILLQSNSVHTLLPFHIPPLLEGDPCLFVPMPLSSTRHFPTDRSADA